MEKKEKNYPELDALTSEETVKTEIYPGMTVEEINAVFFDTDALREPPYRVYQLNGDGHRYYYRFDESGEPVFYPSVTTLLKQVMPTSPFLIEWMLANGKEGAVEKRDLAAAYGTFMHIQFIEAVDIINIVFSRLRNIGQRLLRKESLVGGDDHVRHRDQPRQRVVFHDMA